MHPAEAKFGKDRIAELFPDSAYQLTHNPSAASPGSSSAASGVRAGGGVR